MSGRRIVQRTRLVIFKLFRLSPALEQLEDCRARTTVRVGTIHPHTARRSIFYKIIHCSRREDNITAARRRDALETKLRRNTRVRGEVRSNCLCLWYYVNPERVDTAARLHNAIPCARALRGHQHIIITSHNRWCNSTRRVCIVSYIESAPYLRVVLFHLNVSAASSSTCTRVRRNGLPYFKIQS